MDHPRVSICIPLYNRAALIEETLDSTLAENVDGREVIVLDDGSTDGSGDIVRRWIERHPTAGARCERQPHGGIPQACNRLVDLAKGDFLVWLGSDDLLLDGGIAARAAYLDAHPEKLGVFAEARVIDPAGRTLFESVYSGYRGADKRKFQSDRGLRAELISRWCVPQPVLMVRRKIYDVVGRYDESFLVEDYDFYLRMLARDVLGFLDVPVGAYRLHPENFCRHADTRTAMMRQFLRAARKNRAHFRPWEQVRLLMFGAGALIKAVGMDVAGAMSAGRLSWLVR